MIGLEILKAEENMEIANAQNDMHVLKGSLITILHDTIDRCEKISTNVEDQERFVGIASVPRVQENRNKAKIAANTLQGEIGNICDMHSLNAFIKNLENKQGLFFRIFRGKCKTHPEVFPEHVRPSVNFKI